MKKKTGTTAFAVANAVVLTLILLNRYKPELADLALKYVKVKRKQTRFTTLKNIETKRIIKQASKVIEKPKKLTSKVPMLETADFRLEDIIAPKVYSHIVDQFMNFNTFNVLLAKNITSLYPKCLPAMYTPIDDIYNLPMSIDGDALTLNINDSMPTYPTLPFGKIIGMMALIITLNTLGSDILSHKMPSIDFSQETVSETIQDLEEFFDDKLDVIVTFNNHDAIIQRKVERIMGQDMSIEEKLMNIMSLKKISYDDKIKAILDLDDISYSEKFDFFINSNFFTYDEAIRIIANANTNEFGNNFDYIMNLNNLEIEEKISYIINSNHEDYKEIFDYILDNPKINNSLGGEMIASSNIASYEEMFEYFIKRDDSLDNKVWNIMLIPNQDFGKVFNNLLEVDGISQDDIITSIMKTELVDFDTLFTNIRDIENISSKDIVNYLIYYNKYFGDSYKSIPLKDIVTYALNIETFSYQDKLTCFWGLLDNLTIEGKQQFILDYYNIDYIEDYIPLLLLEDTDLTSDQKMIFDLFANINELKLDYILNHYEFNSVDEFKAICAGCAAEGANDYKDIYWVANIIFNRITHPRYSKKGTNPYAQFTSPSQFAVYIEGDYLSYLNPSDDLHEEKNKIATQAVLDMFYLGYDGIEHDYIEFRSWGITDFSNNYVVEGGNRYKVTLKDENRLIYDDLNGSEDFKEENEMVLSIKK